MQVCAASDNGQRFMAGVAAHGRAQCNRMLTALRQKTQVSTVGIIHQKRNAKILAHFGQRCNILHTAQIIRTGDVDAKRLPCRAPVSFAADTGQLQSAPASCGAGQSHWISKSSSAAAYNSAL